MRNVTWELEALNLNPISGYRFRLVPEFQAPSGSKRVGIGALLLEHSRILKLAFCSYALCSAHYHRFLWLSDSRRVLLVPDAGRLEWKLQLPAYSGW